MGGVDTVLRYAHTLRHLRPVQIYGRAWHRLHRPPVDARPAPPRRAPRMRWPGPALRAPSWVAPTRARFLEEERDILHAEDWQTAHEEPLWLYNLHYFEDLNAVDAAARAAWHTTLIERWVRENPPARGLGWDPYPTSLRTVAWMRWLLAGGEPPPGMLHSLAIQLRWLAGRLEHHLLGNHLFVNLKALVFAGAFFEGPEAQALRARGERLLVRELGEQFLADGGHFERSPMYHALLFEDVLDLLACDHVFPGAIAAAAELRETAERMARWLRTMTHPDGEIALFNDATLGVAGAPGALLGYARALGIAAAADEAPGTVDLANSGYTRVELGRAVLFVDSGPLGPDYLPAHGHADTLSFELSFDGARLIVDSGVSQYGSSPERLRQRSTAAHNTVTVDDADSSEVWGGFRVARRAHVIARELRRGERELVLSAAHDGFRRLRGGVTHTRTFHGRAEELLVVDELSGGDTHEACVRVHLAPGVEPRALAPGTWELRDGIRLQLDDRLAPRLVRTTYQPRMGSRVPTWVLEGRCRGPLPLGWETRFSWADRS